jgi:hypothetical protein
MEQESYKGRILLRKKCLFTDSEEDPSFDESPLFAEIPPQIFYEA